MAAEEGVRGEECKGGVMEETGPGCIGSIEAMKAEAARAVTVVDAGGVIMEENEDGGVESVLVLIRLTVGGVLPKAVVW